MAEEVLSIGKRAIKVKEEPVSDDEVICEPVAKSPKRSHNLSECVVKTEPKDDVPVTKSSSAKIKIAIKATKEKHTVKITRDATVKELKNEAARAFKMPAEKVCLIYSGKVLNDSDILSAIRIEDGHILHLIVKTNVARSCQKEKLRKRNFFMKQLPFKRDLPSANEKKGSAINVEEKHQNPSLIGPNATIGIPNVLDPASSSEEEQNDFGSFLTRVKKNSTRNSSMKKKIISKRKRPRKIHSLISLILCQRKEMDKKLSELQRNISNIRKSIHILNKSMMKAGNLLYTVLQKRYMNYNIS